MRSRYRVYPDSGVYFVTSTIIDWVPLAVDESIAEIILESFKFCQAEKGLRLSGFVIMPNHFHAVIGMENPDGIPSVMRDLKRHTSQEISTYLEQHDKRKLSWLQPFYGKKINKVWQEGYHPELLKSDKWFLQKLEYIHYNPVKSGFVERPEHWKYSSARNYILGDHSLIKLDVEGM